MYHNTELTTQALYCRNNSFSLTLEHTTEVVVALDDGISCSPNNEHCTEESNDSQSPVIHIQNPLSPGEGTANMNYNIIIQEIVYMHGPCK